MVELDVVECGKTKCIMNCRRLYHEEMKKKELENQVRAGKKSFQHANQESSVEAPFPSSPGWRPTSVFFVHFYFFSFCFLLCVQLDAGSDFVSPLWLVSVLPINLSYDILFVWSLFVTARAERKHDREEKIREREDAMLTSPSNSFHTSPARFEAISPSSKLTRSYRLDQIAKQRDHRE